MRLMTLRPVFIVGDGLPPRLRTCDATRPPLCSTSTVATVERISTASCTRLYGTL